MLFSVILLMFSVPGYANDVTRDFFGDIFRMRDCHNGSRCDDGGRRAALPVPGRPCYCQCAPTHLAYREDKQQCVKDIKECYMSVFYRPFTVEAIPLVYLPTSGQLVHPDAHLSLSMRRNFEGGLAKCRVTLSQYLTREGWRTLTKMDGSGGSVFGLFTDANKTYLQFLGTNQDRKMLQQHLSLVRLLCIIPNYPAFETCVAVRIGWVPGVENVEDIPAPSNKANMMVVGLSLGVLALVYIFAVLVYLKIRRQMIAKQKTSNDQEAKLQNTDDSSDKTSSLHRLEASSRLELYHTSSLGRQKNVNKSFRNNLDPWNQLSPIVETYNRTWTDRMGQHSSEFRAQDFKLQPEFFEPEFMASPPHEVLEYLERLQNSITFARHRMRSCYRYQPTLNGIPEDDYFYQELESKDSQSKEARTTPDGGSSSSVGSVQEGSEENNEVQKREFPKIPPRKPKRKTKDRSESSTESQQSSDQEQKEIQNAMNALNDTLDALEFDMYKQEMLTHTSDSENGNLSCQNSTSIDLDDFETSSCSSISAVTVLGRDAKRLSDISKASQYMEKNQSEDFSTFSNSTYSISETMRGLFQDNRGIHESVNSNVSSSCSSRVNNRANSIHESANSNVSSRCSSRANNRSSTTHESENNTVSSRSSSRANHKVNSIHELGNSNVSSRCSSRASFISQPENYHRQVTDERMNIKEETDVGNKSENETSVNKVPNNEIRPKSRADDANSSNSGSRTSTLNSQKSGRKSKILPAGGPLRKSPSSESMSTTATDMTVDSLDSRCTSPTHPSPTPSLMEMWISKLVSNSVSYSKSRRKTKKKLVLPEDDIESWEHVCQKHKDPCPMHDLNDSEPNLIDKLAHYGSKTMAGCDVAGYFQSLKQDVLKEHLKLWLNANNQSKRNKNAISMTYNNECSHTKPLVNGQENNFIDENGLHLNSTSNSRSCSVEALNYIGHKGQDINIMGDSTDRDQTETYKANGNIYYGAVNGTSEKCIET